MYIRRGLFIIRMLFAGIRIKIPSRPLKNILQSLSGIILKITGSGSSRSLAMSSLEG
jgi:hypothetical protein